MATIATHNGTVIARAHNIRDKRVISKEPHIDPEGKHETWIDYTVRNAYHRLFDAAVAEYNSKQKRADRIITDYYKKVKEDKQKNTAYEMIVSVGNYSNPIPEEMSYIILKRFAWEWNKNNPNMVVIGAYYHADEQGVPHCHIDYVPIATNCSRGMKRQVSLSGALKEMGYESDSIHETAQIKWQRAQNQRLEAICNEYGIEVEHPKEERQHEADKMLYIAKQVEKDLRNNRDVFDLEIDNTDLTNRVNTLERENHTLRKRVSSLESCVDFLDKQLSKLPQNDFVLGLRKSIFRAKNSIKNKVQELEDLEL